jgi:hypothetical protein
LPPSQRCTRRKVLAPPWYVPWIRTVWKGLAECAKPANWTASAEPEPVLASASGVTLRSKVADGPVLDDSPAGRRTLSRGELLRLLTRRPGQ